MIDFSVNQTNNKKSNNFFFYWGFKYCYLRTNLLAIHFLCKVQTLVLIFLFAIYIVVHAGIIKYQVPDRSTSYSIALD